MINTGMLEEVNPFLISDLKTFPCTDGKFVAVTPDEAAESLIKFIQKFDMKMTGEYWAPRGPG